MLVETYLTASDSTRETFDGGAAFVTLGMLAMAVFVGVVFVFTTNCSLDLIDRAFKRPGRIDLIVHFRPPDAGLRRRLIERWHPDILACLDLDEVVQDTDGYSFAEVEELKNLLILHYTDASTWDWGWALRQFAFNRRDLNRQPGKRVGFGPAESRNGNGVHAKEEQQ